MINCNATTASCLQLPRYAQKTRDGMELKRSMRSRINELANPVDLSNLWVKTPHIVKLFRIK